MTSKSDPMRWAHIQLTAGFIDQLRQIRTDSPGIDVDQLILTMEARVSELIGVSEPEKGKQLLRGELGSGNHWLDPRGDTTPYGEWTAPSGVPEPVPF